MHENKKILLNNYNLLPHPDLSSRQIIIDVLRLDAIHPVISGNKWFKLKGWLSQARANRHRQILTFGGAWSNHIAAAAYAAKLEGLSAIAIIRGERPATPSQTLLDAAANGMQLEFISREQYAKKNDPLFLDALTSRFPHATIIPEGGAGAPGIRGCQEILQTTDTSAYTHILCALGTGTMYQGLIDAAAPGQTVLGIAVLKGFDPASIRSDSPHPIQSPSDPPSPVTSQPLADASRPPAQTAHRIITDYHFGGYARHTPALLAFMNEFYRYSGIPTDFVYTAKLCFATLDLIRKDQFPPNSRLLIIHSGGLQGNRSLQPGVLYF